MTNNPPNSSGAALPAAVRWCRAIGRGIGLTLLMLASSCMGPAYRSEGQLERELLKATPLGTPMPQVLTYVAKQGWKIAELSDTHGFLDQSSRWMNPANYAQGALSPDELSRLPTHGASEEPDPRPKLTYLRGPYLHNVGQKHIRAEMGDFHTLPFITSISVFWGFDENGKLIDIWVWKTVDGL